MLVGLSEDDLAGLVEARKHRPRWHRFSEDRRPRDEDQAYRLQQQTHEALGRAGIRRVGYKIASISAEGQRSLGLSEPAYAGIYDLTRKASLREALELPFIAPSVECEIAFVIATELHPDGDLSDDTLRAAIASAHLACEVVDNRYGKPLDVGIPTILTDDFFHAAFVLGAAQAGWQSLLQRDLPGAIEIDGTAIYGNTADAPGPFEALRWLVRKLASHGQRLGAGEIVLAGSLVKPTPVSLPARSVTISVEGFEPLCFAG
jgi:2-keto-4-pentenoate hydratase